MSESLVITLCGSTRFEREFHSWNKALTYSGHTVISLTAFPSVEGKKAFYSDQEKAWLDKAHKQKIDISDAIFVINKWAYIGESTLSEIEHAKSSSKKIYFLESWGKGCGLGSMHSNAAIKAASIEIGDYIPASPIDATGPNPYDLLDRDFRQMLLDIVGIRTS